ncbi:DUF58 domain-containing protein, partial [Enterococcus faecium]
MTESSGKKQQLNAYQRGLDFREHRAYRPGDSFNRIDWKLWNGNSFFDKFYKVQNFFPYAIPIVL